MEAALALLRMEIRSLSLAGNYNSKSRQSTAGTYSTTAKKKQCLHPETGKKEKSPFWMAHGPGIICASLPEIWDSFEGQPCLILEEEFEICLALGLIQPLIN